MYCVIAPAGRLCARGEWTAGPLPRLSMRLCDAAGVGRAAHLPAQRVDLPHQVALCGAADGGVAGRIAHTIQIGGDQQRLLPQPGRSQSGFDARVARADDHHVVFFLHDNP